ncbi:diacylglycerol/lipid kinase family protein [Kineococcus gynurae]|uniref:Diacylglycerol/lipid kinase family protein n=1 Tax=Kineococcus gynurae TaxID=452979 RepID=A0ABV5LSH1_9ACTN
MTVAEILDTTVASGVLLALLVVTALLWWRDHRALRRTRERAELLTPVILPSPPEETTPRPQRAAMIVNPAKFADLDDAAQQRRRAYVDAVFRSHGWADPLWLSTTVADPGPGQAREALTAGVDVVVACGGDGTVRAVAEAMAGSEVPMALLPAGTGNLLARNLDVPHADLAKALDLIFTAPDRRIDVGRLRVNRTGKDTEVESFVFLVMAGMGFDAAMVAGAPPRLKQRLGYGAYVVSGARALWGPQARVRMRIDDGEPFSLRTRAVVVGNCGKLTRSLVLMPAAEIDDGLLDAVAISPRGGIGWGEVAWAILTRDRRGQRRVQHLRGVRMSVVSEQAQEVQLDGDPIGPARRLDVEVDAGALLVRAPG